jgi:hypothetical protein
VQMMALIGDQGALVVEKGVGFPAAGAAQRQCGSDGINARASSVRARPWPFLFLRHPAHSLLFKAIEPDGNPTGNRGRL